MLNIAVEIDQAMLDGVQSAMQGIKDGYPKVLVTSINKTLTTVNTQAAARVGNELNLKASRIKEDFTLIKASYSKPSGSFVAKGEPIGLVQFGANQTQKGVSVKVKRSGSRSLLKHAYIAKGKGDTTKQHVWWRKGRTSAPAPKRFAIGKKVTLPGGDRALPKKYRIPLERKTGPRIEDILDDNHIFDPLTIQANHVFLQNVEKQIDDVLRRYQNG